MTETNTPPQQPHPTPPPTTFAFTVLEVMDDVGRRIVHRKPLFGPIPADFDEFIGVNQIIVRVGGENGTQQPSAYRFPIQGVKTIEEAFGVWDQLSRAFGDMHIADLRRQYRAAQEQAAGGLIVPDAVQAKRILTPGG